MNCNHTEAIARALYKAHATAADPSAAPDWYHLPASQQEAWKATAREALPAIARHAAEDLAAYAREQLAASSPLWKKILWGSLAAIAAGLAAMGLSSCGHTVDITQEAATICKDGTCLTVGHSRITVTRKGK